MGNCFYLEMARDAEARAQRFKAKGDWRAALRWLGFAADAYGQCGEGKKAAECWAAAGECCRWLQGEAAKRVDAVG